MQKLGVTVFKGQRVVQEIAYKDTITLTPPFKYDIDCARTHVMLSRRSLRDVGGILEVMWTEENRQWK